MGLSHGLTHGLVDQATVDDRGESAKGCLTQTAMIGLLDPRDDRQTPLLASSGALNVSIEARVQRTTYATIATDIPELAIRIPAIRSW